MVLSEERCGCGGGFILRRGKLPPRTTCRHVPEQRGRKAFGAESRLPGGSTAPACSHTVLPHATCSCIPQIGLCGSWCAGSGKKRQRGFKGEHKAQLHAREGSQMRASFFAAAAAAGVLAAALLVMCAPTASASAVFKKDADLYEGAVAPRDRPCRRFAHRRAVARASTLFTR